ncbi:hypothetical protein BT69DRAFT_1318507 [Atractiella rhizophila]|nr:hypothetical protein BT69DRAFT_1318507 [Atractiella rhizophila]
MPPKSKLKGLNPVEAQLYQAGLAKDDKILTMQDIQRLPGVKVDQALRDALNSLMKKNLFNVFQDKNKVLSYRVVEAAEAKSLAAMEGDEKLVLDYVTEAGNQGIWTKTLKMKTNLHQTVINRVLKALEQKKLIKSVKAVKYPTRKMYMREHLQPSIELTGGPWFSDNELDVEFVSILLKLISKFLSERTFPSTPGTLYPVAHNAYLPSLEDITNMIRSKNVTSVELQTEHVESLLDVLIADGEVEAVFVTETKNLADEDEESEDDGEEEEEEEASDEEDEEGKKMRERNGSEVQRPMERKGKKVSFEDEDVEDAMEVDEEEEESEEEQQRKKKKKKKSSFAKSKKKKKKVLNPFSFSGPTTVYRSLVAHRPAPLIGLTTIPCGHCPVFDLCSHQGSPAPSRKTKEKEAVGMIGGWMAATGTGMGTASVGERRRNPVNPVECRYYDEWLKW